MNTIAKINKAKESVMKELLEDIYNLDNSDERYCEIIDLINEKYLFISDYISK